MHPCHASAPSKPACACIGHLPLPHLALLERHVVAGDRQAAADEMEMIINFHARVRDTQQTPSSAAAGPITMAGSIRSS